MERLFIAVFEIYDYEMRCIANGELNLSYNAYI